MILDPDDLPIFPGGTFDVPPDSTPLCRVKRYQVDPTDPTESETRQVLCPSHPIEQERARVLPSKD